MCVVYVHACVLQTWRLQKTYPFQPWWWCCTFGTVDATDRVIQGTEETAGGPGQQARVLLHTQRCQILGVVSLYHHEFLLHGLPVYYLD